ncbi:MAG: S8 family serine peptidase [Dermatophilaceae bacterium]|jgi:subtilisin family serine protease
MSITSSRRRALVVATALAAAATCGIAMAGPTAAAPSAVTASTPVPSDFPDGMLMSYVINTKANPGQVRLAERAVAAAGGVVVQSWPQIGVVVAHSDRANFRTAVKDNGKNAIESIGATRTASVTEGTPEGIQTPWGPGAAAYKKGAKKPANGDLPGEIAPGASAGDPLENAQWDKVLIKADQARKITEGNRNVLVGVLDSGIEADHPDLAANIDVDTSVNCTAAGRPDTSATGWQPTTSTHGTHVAGIIAAAHNGVGLVGVAPNVRMASVKVVNDDGYIYPEYAICGFVWAGMQKMDLTNNSYYVDPFEFWCDDQPDQAAAKEAVRRAVAWSRGQGVAHVAAAGNSAYDLSNKTTDSGSPNDTTPVTRQINAGCQDIPTELPGVVTVSSLQQWPAGANDSRLSGFSNRGLGVIDVAAPGSRIASTVLGGGYAFLSGTSMASPNAAGVMALLKSTHPTWGPDQLEAGLYEQATPKACGTTTGGAPCVGTPEMNSYFGHGVVDALKAVQ